MSQCGCTGLMSHRAYRCVRKGYVLPILPKCPAPVWMLYRYRYQLRCRRLYRHRRYWYWCRTELTEVSGTGIDVVQDFADGRLNALALRVLEILGVRHEVVSAYIYTPDYI